jgi:response regulator of citrate/malate metabolism
MNIEKIRFIDEYIQSMQTDKPEEFARKLNISKSMLFRYLNYMKAELKAPISYNRVKQSYQYEEKGVLTVKGWLNN